MAIEKTLLAVAGVALAGFVSYKIVKKKKPEWIAKSKKCLKDAGKGPVRFFEGARQSFREGYASV